MVLVDTSVFVNYFKGKKTAATVRLESLLDSGCVITSVIYQELLQGAKDKREFSLLQAYLSTQTFCHPLDSILSYEKAAQIYFDCRKKGLTVRSKIDCLIAQLAIEHELSLLHDDEDFTKIAKVVPLRLAI